jgi:O-antigen ligase
MTEEPDGRSADPVAEFAVSSERPGVVSDRRIMATARGLRRLSNSLEWLVFLLLAASALAIGSIQPWAYRPLWLSAIVLVVLTALRVRLVARLRQQLGRQRFSFHSSDRWLVLDEESGYGIKTWGFDLARPLVPFAPLLLPGLAFGACALLQVVALPPFVRAALNVTQPLDNLAGEVRWKPLTVSLLATFRGLAFLGTALVFHITSAIVFDSPDARASLLRRLRFLGIVLALLGLAQLASGTHLIYWFYEAYPFDGNALLFGPFTNRNHFAAYMLMLTALAFGWLAHRLKSLSKSVGRSTNLRRLAVNALERSGPDLLYAVVPALTMVAALIATTSRGALVAFAAGLLLVSFRLFRRTATPTWGIALLFSVVAVTWFGLDRLESRFSMVGQQAVGRTVVWHDSLQRMQGHWITGFGLNTFGAAISRTTAWRLPEGATPWTDPYETSIAEVARAGYRTISGGTELDSYREAHNDYLQLLTEVGAVGLLIALWGLFRLVRRTWPDPWLLAAVVAPLLHAFVDFGFQIPAVAVLFATISALRPARE